MRLLAISDLHLEHAQNWQALLQLPPHPEDWLLLAGDISEKTALFRRGLRTIAGKFARVVWTPGNHDLWTLPTDPFQQRGLAKYNALVEICREFNVLTPEDPFTPWPPEQPELLLAPTFTLFDYSFRPPDVPETAVLEWARESGVISTDEFLLHTDPYPSFGAWCASRCRTTETRLRKAAKQSLPLHPAQSLSTTLRPFLSCAAFPASPFGAARRAPPIGICRFPVRHVVYGHLHIPKQQQRDGTVFHEVSLGYPVNWQPERGMAALSAPNPSQTPGMRRCCYPFLIFNQPDLPLGMVIG
jgi:predicted phosphohydrolase